MSEWTRDPGIEIPLEVAEHFGGHRWRPPDLELLNPNDPDREGTELPDFCPPTTKWVAVWGDEIGLWDPVSNRVWSIRLPSGEIYEQTLGEFT